MKRAWRWPFAGFVVGALVGATILTVNVVGASSPERPPAGAGSFGEILHTPVLLARAGEPVELRYDVVCGASQDEPRAACSPKGSVFVRPEGRSTFVEHPLARDAQAGCSPPRCPRTRRAPASTTTPRSRTGAARVRVFPRERRAAPHHVWPLRTWTTVAPRRALPRDAGSWLGGRKVLLGQGPSHARAGQEQSRIGPSAFDVAPDGSVVLLDQVNGRLVVSRRGAERAADRFRRRRGRSRRWRRRDGLRPRRGGPPSVPLTPRPAI